MLFPTTPRLVGRRALGDQRLTQSQAPRVALDLLHPMYRATAAYGHFGREEPEFTWEATDKAAALRADAGL